MKDEIRQWLASERFKEVRKVVVGFVGTVVILAGIIMIFIPGPALLVIPSGFAILAIEFPWARRVYEKAKGWLQKMGWLKSEGHGGRKAKRRGPPLERRPAEGLK